MSGAMIWVISPNSDVCNGLEKKVLMSAKFKNVGKKNSRRLEVSTKVVANTTGSLAISSEQLVYDVVLKQAALVRNREEEDMDVKPEIVLPGSLGLLSEAYDRCGEVCAEYAKTFYLGTLLMTPERRKAIWAMYGEVPIHLDS